MSKDDYSRNLRVAICFSKHGQERNSKQIEVYLLSNNPTPEKQLNKSAPFHWHFLYPNDRLPSILRKTGVSVAGNSLAAVTRVEGS